MFREGNGSWWQSLSVRVGWLWNLRFPRFTRFHRFYQWSVEKAMKNICFMRDTVEVAVRDCRMIIGAIVQNVILAKTIFAKTIQWRQRQKQINSIGETMIPLDFN